MNSGSSEQLNESFSDQGEGDSPTKGGRMTRLRARGGVRDRPPIIDEDDDDVFTARARAPVITPRKRKVGRKPAAEKVDKEKPIVEKVVVDKERDVNLDETSLYYIVRHSKSVIAVCIFILFHLICKGNFAYFKIFDVFFRVLLMSGLRAINKIGTWH